MTQHDQVQQAAYELIPPHRQNNFHLLLGTRLYLDASDEDVKEMIFFIVDNMNKGEKMIRETDKRVEIVKLNLQAGEKALSLSAFQSASKYLLAGISFLDSGSWETHYNLTLQLYDAGWLVGLNI